MMKRIFISLMAGLLALSAAAEPVERIFVSTDKGAYVAGDLVGCSLFVIDASGAPAWSTGSSIAYLELVSTEGTAATAKIALIRGRGAGVFPLPLNIPTGRYALIAYTSRNRNEADRSFLAHPRVISVYNTLSTARVEGGIDWEETPAAAPAERTALGGLDLRVNRRVRAGSVLPVILSAAQGASVSVSVYRTDDVPEPANPTIGDFMAGLPAPGSVRMTGTRLPDFDGEVIYASIAGKDRGKAFSDAIPMAVISAQGAASDTYVSGFRDGQAVFFTNNIYGNRDLVCELTGLEDSAQCFLQLESPFLYPTVGNIPRLPLSESLRESLQARHAAMLAFHESYADTLADFLPKRENLLLRREDARVYHLDDYVRFPTVEEVIVEIVRELRIRKGKRRVREVQMLYTDKAGAMTYFRDNILVLLDGIAVTDHARILEYDAMLFEDVEIYSHPYLVGESVYNGIVNFTTRKGGSLSLRLTDLAQVVDFQGASYPLALTGKHVPADRDLRQTLYWHPAITLPSDGGDVRLEVRTPPEPGRFHVVVEGLDAALRPVRSESFVELY